MFKKFKMSFSFRAQGLVPQRLCRWARRVLFDEQWMVGIVDRPVREALRWSALPPVRWIAAYDTKRSFADPFPWPGSADTIVCESSDPTGRQDYIAVAKLDANGIAIEIKVDFPAQNRLSFPFLFMLDGVVFAMPESSASQRLEIFRWLEQDGVWIPHARVFADKPVADAVLFEENGLFWIAYTDLGGGADDDNLHLIYAPELTGPWRAHPSNPVRRGRGVSRNGGAVFEADGRLYRPAQDRAGVIGAVRIMEIVVCTPLAYEEREVTRIVPSSPVYPDGFRTLVPWGDKCLVDGMRLVFSPRLMLRRARRKLGV